MHIIVHFFPILFMLADKRVVAIFEQRFANCFLHPLQKGW